MTPHDDLTALRPVIAALDSLGVEHYISGSLASSVHGRARATIDIDVVADLRLEHVESLVAPLTADYYIDQAAVRRAIAEQSSFNAIHLSTMYKIDVFIMKDRPFDREARRRVVLERLSESEPRRDAVASPEDVVLSKLEWYRAGGELSERQWGDVIGVLQVQADRLDTGYLRHWARDLGVLDLLERALDEAAIDS